MVFVDSNVILDIWTGDPAWSVWSQSQLRSLSLLHELVINPIVYAEISVVFPTPDLVDGKLDELGVTVLDLPRSAAFLSGKVFVQYRRLGGPRTSVLPDLFIGAEGVLISV
jgi:predicted nucleic acid-binding protein